MVPPLKMKGSATMSATPNKANNPAVTPDVEATVSGKAETPNAGTASKAEAAKTETPATAAGTPDVAATDTAKTDTPTAGTAAKARKGVQVSATVSQEFYEKWDELHWEKRMSPTDMVREAVQEYAKANGITVPAKA
jgi:cell pole-organizing protein PopZ